MNYVVGIDPSITCTAVCLLGEDLALLRTHCVRSKPAGPSTEAWMKRCYDLVAEVRGIVRTQPTRLIVIEGASSASVRNHETQRKLAEYAGILKYFLWAVAPREYDIVVVPPLTLKQFVLGKGKGQKSEMRLALFKRFGVEFQTDDEADAYGLARLGACLLGWDTPANDGQRKAIKKVCELEGIDAEAAQAAGGENESL